MQNEGGVLRALLGQVDLIKCSLPSDVLFPGGQRLKTMAVSVRQLGAINVSMCALDWIGARVAVRNLFPQPR